MKAPDFEAEPVIEPVRRVVGGVAVEHDDLAIPLAGEVFEMADQKAADAGGALVGIDDEVVDFQVAAAPDLGGDPGTGDA